MKNYTNYQELKRKWISMMGEFWDVFFDVNVYYDDNRQKYLYVQLKDYGDYRWNLAKQRLSYILAPYEKVYLPQSDRKVLYWVPEEAGLSCLVVNNQLYKIKDSIPLPSKPVPRTPSRKQLIRKIKLENTHAHHYKQWIGELYNNGTVITRWGKIDDENLQSKMFPNAGEDFLNKKEKEKLSKGYLPV